MTIREIKTHFRSMSAGQDRIGILADLTGSTKDDIRELLGDVDLTAEESTADKIVEMVSHGYKSREIAKLLGVTLKYVYDVKSKRGCVKRPNVIDEKLAYKLYEQRLNDHQMAASLRVDPSSVLGWRRRNGLIANTKRSA